MDGTMVYANLILTFGLGMLVTAVTARLSQARRALEMVAKDVPTEDSVARYIEGIVERDLPTALHNGSRSCARRSAGASAARHRTSSSGRSSTSASSSSFTTSSRGARSRRT
jgi:hypothetical protein